MALIRAFIAVKFPEELKGLLKEIQNEIHSGGRDPRSGDEQLKGKVSFVRADNFHLTLKFLGNIDESGLGDILNGLRAAASEVSPFTLTAGSVEIRSGKVLWVPIEGGEALIRLNKALEDELYLLGYKREERRFRGHLTLARIRDKKALKNLRSTLARRDYKIDASFVANALTLFKSELKPGGAVYTVLGEVDLPSAGET